MGDYVPKFNPGDAITRALTGTVTGGRLVTAAGAQAGANAADVIGVASRDGVSGDRIAVFTDGVHRLVATGSIAIGARVKSAANGTVQTWVSGTDAADLMIGRALEAGTDTNELDVLFI